MKKKIAIIGAGLAGLVCANMLKEKNTITVFEKSRGVGGRMATRYKDSFEFDQGAQYFTAKTPEFQKFLETPIKENIIAEWNPKFVEFDFDKIVSKAKWGEHYPHFVAKPRMNSLAKFLSQNLVIKSQTKIKKLIRENEKWNLIDENENFYSGFDLLILAIPNSQALEIIPTNFSFLKEVQNIKMLGCFSLMLGFEKPLALQFEAALVKNSKISWIAVNSSKPERKSSFSLLVNSSNTYAQENIEKDLGLIKEELIEELSEIIKINCNQSAYSDIFRWRHANSSKINGDKFFFDQNLNIALCGDWCFQGRVEAAFLSGYSLAKSLSCS